MRRTLLALAAAALAFGTFASAQDYPSRMITIVVPAPPAVSMVSTSALLMAQHPLGQPKAPASRAASTSIHMISQT